MNLKERLRTEPWLWGSTLSQCDSTRSGYSSRRAAWLCAARTWRCTPLSAAVACETTYRCYFIRTICSISNKVERRAIWGTCAGRTATWATTYACLNTCLGCTRCTTTTIRHCYIGYVRYQKCCCDKNSTYQKYLIHACYYTSDYKCNLLCPTKNFVV